VVIFEELLDSKALMADGQYRFHLFLHLAGSPRRSAGDGNAAERARIFWTTFGSITLLIFGNVGPDKGKGGKFLVLPPGYKGEVPEGYFVFRSPA
jgi:hypothetical protein